VFPKHFDYNFQDPITFPYEGTPCDNTSITKDNFMSYWGKTEGNDWDFTRFNPVHFQLFEQRIQDLLDLGIEADIIILHPYDRWGFSRMPAAATDLYFNYIVSRFAAFRNVWWSLANEYDLMNSQTLADWEHYAQILCDQDPYQHLRSIHNCGSFYDHSKPWITHCSTQRQDVYKCAELVDEYRIRYQKPVVLDEIAYEGNIRHGWGNISGQELTRRFWEATVRGGYAGHGETYEHPNDILWWSHGGVLYGDSHPRLKFLLQILKEIPGTGLKHVNFQWDDNAAGLDGILPNPDYYLFYYGFNRPSTRAFTLYPATDYQVDIIDTWAMTITPAGIHRGSFTLHLPGKEYIAVRFSKVG
jgi:hypothetical protein